MAAKPVIPREKTRREAEAALNFYATEAGEVAAFRLINAVKAACGAISRHPGDRLAPIGTRA
jgi:plasmid stabilization system protein ParE